MKRYGVHPTQPARPLQVTDFEPAPLGETQIAVAIKAVSLNFRDLLVSQNTYFCPIPDGLGRRRRDRRGRQGCAQPDGGDRVATLFFPHWQGGRPEPFFVSGALGH